MSNLSRRTYELRFAPVKMNADGLEAFLFDKYLKTETPVSLTDSSFIDINITGDAASAASDRFKILLQADVRIACYFCLATGKTKRRWYFGGVESGK